jgi:hypothetical protein
MGMESDFRPEDKGRMGKDEAHDVANKLKVLAEGTGEEVKGKYGGMENSITAGDYDEALGALSQMENAPQNIEAQRSILEKLGRGALGAIALVTGRVPESQLERDNKGYPIQPTFAEKFHYFADGSELKEAKRKILDLQRKADFVAKEK